MEPVYLLILIAIAVCCTPNLCNGEGIYYVKPTNSLDVNDTYFDPGALCPGNPCYTFDYYLQNHSLYFTSNTWIQFLSGAHLLDMGPGENLIDFRKVTNLTLAGSKTSRRMKSGEIMPESVISCLSKIGFVFARIEGLSIQHLALYNCGSEPYPKLNIAFALALLYLTNAFLSHVLIFQSRGYGIVGSQCIGNLFYN